MTSEIKIIKMRASTIIESEEHYMSFDSKAGDRMQPITCLCLFYAEHKFLEDLEASKIVSLQPGSFYSYPSNGIAVACSFTLLPKFNYSNQLLSDVIYTLFKKHEI